MTQVREEDVLRERFQELRGEAAQPGRVPDFDAMLERARAEAASRPELTVEQGGAAGGTSLPSVRRFARAGAWASLAVAATVAALLLTDRRPDGDAEFERLVAAWSSETAAGAWQSPTSGLLDVPGMELTRSIPSIGAPVRGLDPSTLPAREPSTREEPS